MSTICVFGDSISWGAYDLKSGGWVERLTLFTWEKSDDISVYNLGVVYGEITSGLLERFEAETGVRIKEANGVVLIFAIGINDSCFAHSKNSLMTLPEEFKANIQKIIERAQVITSKIIFVGLTPVDESKTTPIPWNTDISYKNENVQKYNQIIKSICKAQGIYFIEVFEKWMKLKYWNLLEDGLHPNYKGHKKLFEIVKDFLVQNKLIKI